MHGDGSFATGDNADAEDVGLLSSHGEDFEVEHETKPFLSAFFQSSIPDDIVNDFRYVPHADLESVCWVPVLIACCFVFRCDST